MAEMMKTCWDCNKRQKAFCRTHEIKKNTVICDLIQDEKYIEAGKELVAMRIREKKEVMK
jgi:hypothetical protein